MGKYQFENQDARQWAQWGFDYLKYDWNPIRYAQVRQMYEALRHSGRDIVFSLSNNAPYPRAAKWIPYANLWRITGDSRDNWPNLRYHWQAGAKWAHLQRPGHWNDPDMMTLGWVGWGRRQHYSHLTPNEQYLEVSSFSLMGAPLILGNNLNRMGAFTMNLLTNSEVLAVDQDSLGIAGIPVFRHSNTQVWMKPLSDGSKAVGLFNLGDRPTVVTATWQELQLHGPQLVRDLWRQKDIAVSTRRFSAEVPPHGVVLIKAIPAARK
jgi:alpha-galactosidase